MNFVIIYLLKVCLISAIAFFAYLAFFRKSTFHQINRFYLLGSTILSFVLPLLPLSIKSSNVLYSYTLPTIEIGGIGNSILSTATEINYLQILIGIYVLVALFLLLKLGYTVLQLKSTWKKLPKEKLANCTIITSNKSNAAYSFFSNIVLPSELENNYIQYNLVLQHEKIHVLQNHSIDILLVEFAKVVLWFNPIIYALKKELAAQHEYFVDRKLLEKEKHIESYGQLLINQTLKNDCLVLANAFNNSLIKNRINMMTKAPNAKHYKLNYLFIVPLIFALSIMVSCQKDGTTSNENKSSLTEKRISPPPPPPPPAPPTAPKPKANMADVFTEVDEMPTFNGGDNALLKHLYTNITYPAEAREKGIEGMVVIEFVVEKDGSISNINTLRDIGGGCAEEAERVIATMPKWTPGKQNGEVVKVSYKLPVKYKLQ